MPRVGLLDALHTLQEKEGVKVFAALYSLALGMEVGSSSGSIGGEEEGGTISGGKK